MKNPFQLAAKAAAYSAFALLTLGFSSCGDDDDADNNNNNNNTNQTVSQQDRTFALQAGMSNTAEIQLSQVALQNAQHDSVKAFAQMMIADHTNAQNELKTLGTQKGVLVKDSLDAAHQAMKNMLQNMTGHAFDSAYMTGQVADHLLARTIMQTEINNGQHQDFKAYASQKLPIINMHHTHAVHIKSLIGE